MIVTCPQCATQYNLPDASVRQGAKARCARCKTIFVLQVPMQGLTYGQSQAYVQNQAYAQSQKQGQNQIQAQTVSQPYGQPSRHVMQQPMQQAMQQSAQHGMQQPNQGSIMADGLPPLSSPPPQNSMASALGLPSFMQDSGFAPQGLAPQMPQAHMNYDQVSQAPHMGQSVHYGQVAQAPQVPQYRQPQSTEQSTCSNARPVYGHTDTSNNNVHQEEVVSTPFQAFMTGLLLLAILGMLGFGAWRYMPRLGNDQLEAEANRIAYAHEQIKDIALHNVRQYTVQSAKVGLLLVIEGRAINNFRSPREMIKVEAALYDKDGRLLDSTQQLCGVLVSKLQMQIWDAKEIEAALDNELKAYERNVNIASGTSVPFMIVFMNPPASVASYGVHVVDAQASPSSVASLK